VSDLKPDRQRRDLHKSNLPVTSRKIRPVLITSAPFPHRALVGLPRRALPLIARLHHVLLLHALLTCVPVTCAARSLVAHPSPIAVGRTADPAMAAGAHVPWRLRFSLAEPRTLTSVTAMVMVVLVLPL
jgi:hypothetical protein